MICNGVFYNGGFIDFVAFGSCYIAFRNVYRMFTHSNFAYDIEGSGWCQMAFNVILIYSEERNLSCVKKFPVNSR